MSFFEVRFYVAGFDVDKMSFSTYVLTLFCYGRVCKYLRRSLRVSINDARFCLLESNRMLSIELDTLFFQHMHNTMNTNNVFH